MPRACSAAVRASCSLRLCSAAEARLAAEMAARRWAERMRSWRVRKAVWGAEGGSSGEGEVRARPRVVASRAGAWRDRCSRASAER